MEQKQTQFAGGGQGQPPQAPVAQPDPVNQPAQTQPQVEQNETAPAVEYATKAELEAFRAEMRRIAQSESGKAEARIQKKIADMKALDISLTPEQAKKLVEKEDEAVHNPGMDTQPSAQPAQGAQTEVPSTDPVLIKATEWMKSDGIEKPDAFTAEAYRMMATANLHIEDNDPEANLIKVDGTPSDFLSTVNAAIQAKAARLSNQGNPARMPVLSSGSPGGAPAHQGLGGTETLESYFSQK